MYYDANITAKNHHSMESIHEFLGWVLDIPGGYGNDIPSLEAALLARKEPLHFYVRSRQELRWKFGWRTTKQLLAMFDRVVEQNPAFSYSLYPSEDSSWPMIKGNYRLAQEAKRRM